MKRVFSNMKMFFMGEMKIAIEDENPTSEFQIESLFKGMCNIQGLTLTIVSTDGAVKTCRNR